MIARGPSPHRGPSPYRRAAAARTGALFLPGDLARAYWRAGEEAESRGADTTTALAAALQAAARTREENEAAMTTDTFHVSRFVVRRTRFSSSRGR